MLNIDSLGQVFTPDNVVSIMLGLKENKGRTLEPSAGAGAFSRKIAKCVAVELDSRVAPNNALIMDFFQYPITEKFSTIVGNPPYVRYQDIPETTKELLDSNLFDRRTNLFLFFIEKSIRHLRKNGELIFIVPREFIRLTAACRLNSWLFERGTITHWIETGDAKIFNKAVPNCAIFRFVLGDLSRRTQYKKLTGSSWEDRTFTLVDGHLSFISSTLNVRLGDLFDVKVGAVSGADEIFKHPKGNLSFVCSHTIDTGNTRRMLYNKKHKDLLPYREHLLARRIRNFDESNWWTWGRAYHDTDRARIYVNGKTRREKPFFVHECKAYDGSILALFPKDPLMDINLAVDMLNAAVPWDEMGFVVDGRYLFSQRTLETCLLPNSFQKLRVLHPIKNTKPSIVIKRTHLSVGVGHDFIFELLAFGTISDQSRHLTGVI